MQSSISRLRDDLSGNQESEAPPAEPPKGPQSSLSWLCVLGISKDSHNLKDSKVSR